MMVTWTEGLVAEARVTTQPMSIATSKPSKSTRRSRVLSGRSDLMFGTALLIVTLQVLANRRGRQQLPRVHDPGGVEALLRGPQHLDAERAGLRGEPLAVVAADRVMVRDRAAVRQDRLRGRRLGGAPLGERVLLLACQEGEVERGARPVQVRHMAHHERRRAAARQRGPKRLANRLVEPAELGPVGGRLERLDEHAAVHQLVAQVGPGVAAALPRLAGAVAERHPSPGPQKAGGAAAAVLHRVLLALEAQD